MTIKKIKISNLLSFDDFEISDFKDLNCIVGLNNTGKSNLMKLISYYYGLLRREKLIAPDFHSNYNSVGSISITYDTSKISKVVTSKKSRTSFHKHIYSTLFDNIYKEYGVNALDRMGFSKDEVTLKLVIRRNGSIDWSSKDAQLRVIINYLYPFFYIEARHIELHNWEQIWDLISKLKAFNVKNINTEDLIDYIDTLISDNNKSFKESISKIKEVTKTFGYSYQEKLLNYVKVGLEGHAFSVDGRKLVTQSDGTNSYTYIEAFLNLLISLSRREYITPIIYIDEPETGLHPKKNEALITTLYEVYSSYKKTKDSWELGKYGTPYPRIFMSTHSPNILKYIVRLFKSNQKVYHFSHNGKVTQATHLNSEYSDKRFLNIFGDDEARLFFSEYILFVEGETELELFRNMLLCKKFPALKRVDVYKANDVGLKYLNPSYSKASIPYLILYDLDKVINIDTDNETVYFHTKTLSLKKIYDKHKYSILFTRNYSLKVLANRLQKDWNGKRYKMGNYNTDIVDPKYNLLLKNLNHLLYESESAIVFPTTIEGALISNNSMNYFVKWLIHEALNSINLKQGFNQSKIDKIERMVARGGTHHEVFNAFFEVRSPNSGLKRENAHKLKVIKLKYIREVLNSINISQSLLITAFRLLFNGKTQSLQKVENVNERIEEKIDFIKQQLACLDYLYSAKTSGWVTLFMEFTIRQIDTKTKGNREEFNNEFNDTFPELYAIIRDASGSIEKRG